MSDTILYSSEDILKEASKSIAPKVLVQLFITPPDKTEPYSTFKIWQSLADEISREAKDDLLHKWQPLIDLLEDDCSNADDICVALDSTEYSSNLYVMVMNHFCISMKTYYDGTLTN